MKRKLTLAALLVALAPAASFAQVDNEIDKSIVVNPIDLFTGVMNLEYEQAFGEVISVYGAVNYLAFRGVLQNDVDNSLAVGPEVGLRLYLIGDAPAGLWIGPYVGAAYVRNEVADVVSERLGYGAGAMAGANIVLGQFNLSLGIGTGWVDYSTGSGDSAVGLVGVVPRGRVAVGVVF